MKVKFDFVTNSSSTCYILLSRANGFLPVIKKDLRFLEKFYKDSKQPQFIYQHYAFINESVGDSEEGLYNGEKSYAVKYVIKNTSDWDEDKQEVIPVTLFRMELFNENPYDYPQLELMKELLEDFLFKKLQLDTSFQLMYTAHVQDTSGDGWDGGDGSSGPSAYEWRHDLYQAETKIGILTVLQKMILDEIHGVGDALTFNQMVLDKINNSGSKIEGTK